MGGLTLINVMSHDIIYSMTGPNFIFVILLMLEFLCS